MGAAFELVLEFVPFAKGSFQLLFGLLIGGLVAGRLLFEVLGLFGGEVALVELVRERVEQSFGFGDL